MRVGLVAALEYLDGHPQWAGLLALEAPLDGPEVGECVRRLQVALAEVLECARDGLIIGTRISPPCGLIAELVVAGVLSLVRARMLRGEGRPLAGLAPALMRDVVEPYLGCGAERADAAVCTGASDDPAGGSGGTGAAGEQAPGNGREPAAAPPSAGSRPRVLPIRATPGHMSALWVVAERPYCSSREVDLWTEGSVNDGNIAQLLGRLARRGLIENLTPRRRPGHANSWLITPYGRRVLQLNSHALPAPRCAVPARETTRRVEALEGAA